MKNLSAIPRLSLPETLTILITLVVCLAGFAEAEVKTNYKMQVSNQPEGNTYPMQEDFFNENLPYSHDMTKLTDETEGRNYQAYNSPDSPLEKLVWRHSDELSESDDLDKENEGYGYDEDEYYHLNFKRSDNEMDNKVAAAKVQDFGHKMTLPAKDKNKEIETIETLSFKESHLNMGTNEGQNIMDPTKTFTNDVSRKKLPTYPGSNQLKKNNVRQDTEEKEKDAAKELSSTDMKLTENKNEEQTFEEKDTGKIKVAQVAEDSVKKESNLKDDKAEVAEKPMNDSAEGKENDMKLRENVKLEETFDKLSRTSEESSKIARDDTKTASSEMLNPSELSQLRSRVGFVGSEDKDNQNTAKAEASYDEESGVEANSMLSRYLKENVKRNQNSMKVLYSKNEVDQSNAGVANKFASSEVSEYQNQPADDYFKRRDWKDPSQGMKFHKMSQSPYVRQYQQDTSPVQLLSSDTQGQPPSLPIQGHESGLEQVGTDITLDTRFKNPYGLNMPAKDLENTEYHKNFIKSLKRYKGMVSEDQKHLPDHSNQGSEKGVFINREGNFNMEASEQMKRRSTQSGEKESSESKHSKLRRSSYTLENSLSDSRLHARESQNPQLLSKTQAEDPKLKEPSESNRARRKSQRLEYEVQVKYCSPQEGKNDKVAVAARRVEKDIKTKLTTEEKYSKKYPYSQVSMDDLTKIENSNLDRKVKRKAPVRKRHDQKSVIQTRAAPSGYYSNRVKFGQKNYAKTNERVNPEMSSIMQRPWASLDGHSSAAADKNKMLRSWDVRQQNAKHDPIKRFDDNGSANKGNSLLLVRKADRVATPFEEGTPQNSNEMTPDALSKMLSENDYDVKKTDQKMSESGPSAQNSDYLTSYPNSAGDAGNQRISQLDTQTFKNRGLFVRSPHLDKDDKKYSSKSNLKKTFDKFRDLAGFFKDNEQDSTDNQYQAQELKEGRDIVFSEDKLPDPIVINSDGSEKSQNFNLKPLNSIYSISTNFKTLDQQDKKSEVPEGAEPEKNMLTAEVKAEPSESTWEPALRNVFPEARTINSISKNGNEIIVLDLNQNPLRTNHVFSNLAKSSANAQKQMGMFGITSQIPNNPLTGKKGAYAVTQDFQAGASTKYAKKAFNTMNIQPQKQSSVQTVDNLTSLLKSVMEMEPTATKTLTKRSSESKNHQKFLKELNEFADLNNKAKFYSKRNSNRLPNSFDGFSETPNYNPPGMKSLENLMQNILSEKNPTAEDTWHKAEVAEDKLQKYRAQKLVGENEDSPFENRVECNLEKLDESSNYQDEFWKELTTASDKIYRLRREGAEKRKIRKTIEDSLKEISGKESTQSLGEEKTGKLKSEPTYAKEPSPGSQQGYVNVKESSMGKNADYETHMSDLSESENKNQRDRLILLNDSTRKRKKRKENVRRKRSPDLHNKNKVSTTAVHNTILKNLVEDNDQSVYSPGINRRLFSTNNEADEAEYFTDAYEHDKDLTAEEPGDKCVKNSFNKCIDPMILELFDGTDLSESKIRSRRSLGTGSHTNFKREIDLDESMPNDFQNFLVTSLGSQKELIKKEDGSQYSEDFSVGGSPEAVEDSALEKRDVSSSETRKKLKFKKELYNEENGNSNSLKPPLREAGKHVRFDEKSKMKETSEYDDKLPTQIRIQISNASTKEKKASKPIMEESETTATETETPPKDKEFFDKNKASTLRVNNLAKIHGQPKSKFTYDYDDNQDSTRIPYQENRRRRKKKKYAPESPTKVAKDILQFDEKAMESLLRKVMADQGRPGDHSIQKLPNGVNNHLPQVETVYNPTQDSNKAQLDAVGDGEIGEKSVSPKTDLRSFEEGSVRDLFKDRDKIKLEKSKEYEEMDWNPQDKMKVRQDLNWEYPSLKSAALDTTDPPTPFLATLDPHPYGQKIIPPTSNYFFHPAVTDAMTTSNLYNALKLKQEGKSINGVLNDRQSGRLFRKPLHYDANYLHASEKAQNPILPAQPEPATNPWGFDFSSSKKSVSRNYRNRDLLGIKNRNQLEGKNNLLPGSRRKLVNFYEVKSPMVDSLSPYSMMDSTKDLDYLSGSDEDYLEELEAMKDSQNDDAFSAACYRKTNKFGETPSLHYPYKYRNPEADDNVNEDDEEPEEDYDENNEDEDFDDYSLLSGAGDRDELRGDHGRDKSQSSFSTNREALFQYDLPKEQTMDEPEFFSPLSDAKYTQGRHYSLEDLKDPLSSTSLLKKSNEKASILENNILKNSLMFNVDYDDPVRILDKPKAFNDYTIKNLMKRQYGKTKRGRDMLRQIGSRMFVARKTEVEDNLPFNYEIQKNAKIRRTSYRRNPFNAEFADPDNNFENEAEENKFSGDLMNWRQEEDKEEEQNMGQEREDGVGDVSENLEDTSENNVLENVIGRYIMRKRVATPTDMGRSSNKEKSEEKHKIKKRSLESSNFDEDPPEIKLISKRLSSGHLTENNFRKYHKKNLTGKRQAGDSDYNLCGQTADCNSAIRIPQKREKTQMKRSALDLFKKITKQDKDYKKVESADCRTAGFEPLSSLNDKKYESTIQNVKTDQKIQAPRVSPSENVQVGEAQLKPSSANDVLLADHRKKEKSNMSPAESASGSSQGPWKINLDNVNAGKAKNVEVAGKGVGQKNAKAFLMIRPGARTDERSAAEKPPSISGSFQKEVGTSYRPKSVEGSGISKRLVQKEPLDTPLVITALSDEDAAHLTKAQKTHVKLEEQNIALHDLKSLSIPQPPHVLQRNIKNIRSFVNAVEQSQNARFPSTGRLNKRKSVFPPSNHANIIRDSRHLDEETSKYLGEQIVDAILTHVSANPKFKELIAPGLALRTTINKEDVDIKQKPLHQADISEQLQFFLQKFMLDLEKLAEKQVRRRMCNEIDQQSKKFLQSLLGVPLNAANNKKSTNQNLRTCPEESEDPDYLDDPRTAELLQSEAEEPQVEIQETKGQEQADTQQELDTPEQETHTQEQAKTEKHKAAQEKEAEQHDVAQETANRQTDIEDLMKKHDLLLKLIEDYKKLANYEKKRIRAQYDKLSQQLAQIKSTLKILSADQCDVCGDKDSYNKNSSDYEAQTDPNACPNSNKVPQNQEGNQPNFDSEQTSTQYSCPDPSQQQEENQPNRDSEESATTWEDSGKCTQSNKPRPPKQGGANKNRVQQGNQQTQQAPKTRGSQPMPKNKTSDSPFEDTVWKMSNPQGPPILLLKGELKKKKNNERKKNHPSGNTEHSKKCLPVMFFDENYRKGMQSGKHESGPDQHFEDVVNECVQYPTKGKAKNISTISEKESLTQTFDKSPLTARTFDLLPYKNSTEKIDEDDAHESTESALDTETSSEPDTSEDGEHEEEDSVDDDIQHLEQLNQLSLGDAAGLQLSLKHRNPWMSNLDVRKMEPIQQREKSLKSSVDLPSVASVEASDPAVTPKRARSVCSGSYEGVPAWSHGLCHHFLKPKAFVTRKSPFQSVSRSYHSLKDSKIPRFYQFSKFSSCGKKRIFLRSNTEPRPKRLSAKSSKQRPLPGDKISPRSPPHLAIFSVWRTDPKIKNAEAC